MNCPPGSFISCAQAKMEKFTDTVSLTLISCTRLHAARAEVDTHAVQAEVSLGQHSKTITINNYLAHLNALLGS